MTPVNTSRALFFNYFRRPLRVLTTVHCRAYTFSMAKKSDLTATQLKVWRFVRGFQERKGYPPRGAVVAEKFKMTRQGADSLLSRIVATGHMKKVEDAGCWVAVGGE